MTEARFNLISQQILNIMCEFARKKGFVGVAFLSCLEDGGSNDWVCRMKVCGAMRSAAEGTRGMNYAALSFSKMAEMMDTKTDSGQSARQPLQGEAGLKGGACIKDGSGYIAASFAGAHPEDDYIISLHALTYMQKII
jgi:hypothetical protein